MQDRYVGDIGDFGKYGLLRHLTGVTGLEATKDHLRLSVIWYRFPNENNKSDGKFIGYLNDPAGKDRNLRICDPKLYWELRRLVRERERNVFSIRMSGILPRETAYFGQSFSYELGESQTSKKQRREAWLEGALEVIKEADLVFVDPDNGITETIAPLRKKGPQYLVRPWHNKGPKYTFMDDLKQFHRGEKSLIIYHHLARWDSADQQIRYFAERLQSCLDLPGLPPALQYHRGTARAYFIVPHERHKAVLEKRLASFANSPWCAKPSPHFEVVKPTEG